MISDAVHSASGRVFHPDRYDRIQISSKQADARTAMAMNGFECVASVALALILLETGLLIGWKG